MTIPAVLETHRTLCKRGRVTYHPEWSADRPWVTYILGTAGRHVTSLNSAFFYFRSRGLTLNVPTIKPT